jgi:histidine triad (HIT) family protein
MEVAMLTDPNCVFCKVVAGEIPAATVYRDDNILAFLDIGPLSEGHVLVIPLEHHEKLSEMPPELASALAAHLPSLGKAARDVTGAEGFNVLVNEGKVAGQEVKHVHFHIVPRRPGDGLGYRWNAGKYPQGRIEQLQTEYRETIEKRAP